MLCVSHQILAFTELKCFILHPQLGNTPLPFVSPLMPYAAMGSPRGRIFATVMKMMTRATKWLESLSQLRTPSI